ncbi:hypothetical protein PsorP6_014399 [Peronosclerospora sorghi]|uniref:Uncharacterized protein n=1 Tax=Peronosclerospora sorghi TaxID=230839 RepID=A0ACC0VIA4_9STRA|nr:hypothetical protein PsorP6_014399 [Peronosclerospora sorghi]
MRLRRQYLLLLLVFGVIAKSLLTSAYGSTLSILLLLCVVGVYYWYMKHTEKCVYDDIAWKQAEASAKLDALQGIGDGKVTKLSMAMRKTSFKLTEADTSIITNRIRQHSSKMGGPRKDRQKFLQRNAKKNRVNTELQEIKTADALKSVPPRERLNHETGLVDRGKKKIEKIVEEAVDATL